MYRAQKKSSSAKNMAKVVPIKFSLCFREKKNEVMALNPVILYKFKKKMTRSVFYKLLFFVHDLIIKNSMKLDHRIVHCVLQAADSDINKLIVFL